MLPEQLAFSRLIARCTELDAAVEQAVAARDQVKAAAGGGVLGIETAAAKALKQLEAAGAPALSVNLEEAIAAATLRYDQRKVRLAAMAVQARRAARAQREAEVSVIRTQVAVASTDLQAGIAADTGRRQAYEGFARKVGSLRDQLSALDRALTTTASQAHCQPGSVDEAEPAVSGEPRQAVVALAALATELAESHATLRRSSVFTDCRWRGRLFNHVFMLVPHAIAWWVLPMLGIKDSELWVLVSAAVTQALPPLFTMMQRRRLGPILAQQRAAVAAIGRKLDRVARQGRDRLDPMGTVDDRLNKALAGDANQTRNEERAKQKAQAEVSALRAREAALAKRLEVAHHADVAGLRDQAAALSQTAAHRVTAERERITRERAQALSAADAAQTTALSAAEAAVTAVVGERQALQEEARALVAAGHPAWTSIAATSPDRHPDLLPLGSFAGAQGAISVALVLPGQAAVLVRTAASGRAAALAMVHQLILRALASFPPGAVRLTMIDPVGLGESFAPFLELAHGREGAVAGPVLTAPDAIEQGLADLEAHCAMIIQKRLGARFATLADYNREAGGLREPVRLVIVADVPAGLSERAAERLAALLRSGPRCGVHVWLLADAARPMPAVIDPVQIRAHGVVLRERDGRLHLDHDGAREALFTSAPLPERAIAAALIARTSERAVSASRVAIPFAVLAPTAEQIWTRNSADGLVIPLGSCGAGRNQALELGRGTAQHVLIGGRTGSGKSTLLHILATSAALWYAPSDLQLCLIDFKKGVEFRAYAAAKLPHARVIAIESDREFGVSVLRDLDAELNKRGEAFRAAGVQDVASYRKATGKPLARILLLIDEFQELFTEDDVVARDAALLLDRFVRQGRAFGLHVILGSQTLGGNYSLAKSSLGQMGVRIALPMNEADAHLLLDEDNDASRLLSRPGDAIYNDQAGRAAGNSPFQVCWLPDDERHARLAPLAARAVATGWKPDRPPVVFEGDAPARRADLLPLTALLARQATPADRVLRGWVGVASALHGVAEVELASGAGGNLLILGAQREGAAAVVDALVTSLAARFRGAALQIIASDGEAGDGPFAQRAATWTAVESQAARDAGTVAKDLTALADDRRAGTAHDSSPVVWIVWAAQRVRALRDEEPGGEAFARLLAEGPEVGIHVVLWCDALMSFQRSLGRRALKEFDQRILFQMSQADSLELCDDAGASRLGLHAALHSVASDGRRAKFRPAM